MKAVMMVRDYDPQTGTCGEVDCIEVPKPEIVNEDDVLIKVAYASICGSDPNFLKGSFPVKAPFPLGHEMSGTIEKLGSGANKKGLKPGDRVTGNFYLTCGACQYCRNGMEQFCPYPSPRDGAQSEYVVWREAQVFKIPDSLDLLEATLTEPFAIALHAVEISDMKIGSSVAISGGGGIGLMLVQLAKMSGASQVALIEPVESKRRLGMELGADWTIDPVNENVEDKTSEITGGYGFDIVIESSGNAVAAETALKIAGKAAHVVYFSMYKVDYELPLNLFKYCYHNEIRIQGMFLAQGSFPRAVSMLPRMNFKALVNKIYSLEECKLAYRDQISGKYAKLIFDCQK